MFPLLVKLTELLLLLLLLFKMLVKCILLPAFDAVTPFVEALIIEFKGVGTIILVLFPLLFEGFVEVDIKVGPEPAGHLIIICGLMLPWLFATNIICGCMME